MTNKIDPELVDDRELEEVYDGPEADLPDYDQTQFESDENFEYNEKDFEGDESGSQT